MSGVERLREIYADYNAIQKALSLMSWDRQVFMPAGGASARTQHVGRLTSLAHRLLTSETTQRAVEDAEGEVTPGSVDAASVRVLRREINHNVKIPDATIKRRAQATSAAYEAWKQAKAQNEFSILAPFLEENFSIAGEIAGLLGYKDHIYDPLIDCFEEGATHASAATMFAELKPRIVSLVARIRAEGSPVDDSILFDDWDKERLRAYAQRTAAKIGFRFDAGRLDITPNAFTMNLSCNDVRLTTRASDHIKGILSSSLHEMGHGLYEQGSPVEWDNTPLAGGISLGVHESQSRMWENIIGRSRGFWQFFFADLAETFPKLAPLGPEGFYRAYSKINPTFIRVGGDELTYNLHILVRFELEVEILSGKLKICDLPEAWNAKYTEYLGITPPTDTLGCLQDVHWSKGSVGYFPTYTMGNLIGGQVWKTLQGDVPDVEGLMSRGEFEPILSWLQEKIYRQGCLYPPTELVTRVTGRPMQATDWLDYAEAKYRDIYGLDTTH